MSSRTESRLFRVAFDMDGVLADLSSALARHADALFGEDEAPADPWRAAHRRRRLWNHVRSLEDFWETLDEIEDGGVARLAGLAGERRWETIFLTTRPETAGNPAQVQTHRWLTSKGFPYPSVCVVRGSRGALAAALELDAIVDDRPQNCVDVVSESRARAILVWPESSDIPKIAVNRLRLDVAHGFEASLHLLEKIDDERQRSTSPIARLLGRFAHRPAVLA